MTTSYGGMGKRGLEIRILGVYSVSDLFLGKREVAVKSPKRAFYELIKIDTFPRQKRQTKPLFYGDLRKTLNFVQGQGRREF